MALVKCRCAPLRMNTDGGPTNGWKSVISLFMAKRWCSSVSALLFFSHFLPARQKMPQSYPESDSIRRRRAQKVMFYDRWSETVHIRVQSMLLLLLLYDTRAAADHCSIALVCSSVGTSTDHRRDYCSAAEWTINNEIESFLLPSAAKQLNSLRWRRRRPTAGWCIVSASPLHSGVIGGSKCQYIDISIRFQNNWEI